MAHSDMNKRNTGIYDGNAARRIERQRVNKTAEKKKRNIVKLNEKQLRVARRQNIDTGKVARSIVGVAAIFLMVAYVIYGQVQLTELTYEIENSQQELSELHSVQIQLEMEAAAGKNSDEMREYAETVLGMGAVRGDQVTCISIAQDDEAVLSDEGFGSIFKKLTNTVSSWLE